VAVVEGHLLAQMLALVAQGAVALVHPPAHLEQPTQAVVVVEILEIILIMVVQVALVLLFFQFLLQVTLAQQLVHQLSRQAEQEQF
jgi:hypothetical protein